MEAHDIGWDFMSKVERTVIDPDGSKKILPTLTHPAWVYHYQHKEYGWVASCAAYGAPGSNKLILGGLRIQPEARASVKGYHNDREALELATGMEEKIYWSRICKVGGALGLKELPRIVGGKNVILPSADARIGKVRDYQLMQFIIACLQDAEETGGINFVTGQDLGHGSMSDGKSTSLKYLRDNFRSSVISDTSKPTAEGNYWMLRGCLQGLGIDISKARVGLIGCGNIGDHLLLRLKEAGAHVEVLEYSESKRHQVEESGTRAWDPGDKSTFMSLPLDAIAVNANAGTLDMETVEAICRNPELKLITGCENLAMPDPRGSQRLQAARKIFTPCEMCGMMGYLTAVEEYLSRQAKVPFTFQNMYEPSKKLEEVGLKGTQHAIKKNFAVSFEDAVREIYSA